MCIALNPSKTVATAFTLLLGILANTSFAADKPYEAFGHYKVHYSVFNSSFIQPDIARLYNISRGKDQALVNIAVTDNHSKGGIAANITGTATNLMQQQKTLKFIEVREKNAVYYLAPLRFSNEEILNFSIKINPADQSPYVLKFTKTLYVDN